MSVTFTLFPLFVPSSVTFSNPTVSKCGTENLRGDCNMKYVFHLLVVQFYGTVMYDNEQKKIKLKRRIERFSSDCRKTKTKAITPTNHNRNKQHDEPITIPSNYLKLARSAGKVTRTCRHWFWFWFCFSLAEKLVRLF